MTELRRNYSFTQKAVERLSRAPNLCGLDSFTHGEQGQATAEMLTLAINHGPKEPILVGRDVLFFIERADAYQAVWGDYASKAGMLLSCMVDATPQELEAAADLLSQLRNERTSRPNKTP